MHPGDTQLVRDAGFWGTTLALVGTLGFGRPTEEFSSNDGPSGRTIAGYSLLGLYGGLGLGVLAAANSEVSLERVRVTTWGGYGGGLLGGLVGVSADNSTSLAMFKGVAIGALAGLVITFLSTGRLDGIPPEDRGGQPSVASRWTPAMVPIVGVRGQPQPGFGLAYALR